MTPAQLFISGRIRGPFGGLFGPILPPPPPPRPTLVELREAAREALDRYYAGRARRRKAARLRRLGHLEDGYPGRIRTALAPFAALAELRDVLDDLREPVEYLGAVFEVRADGLLYVDATPLREGGGA